MSTNIYNKNKFTAQAYTKANRNTYSCCTHWLILFDSLDQNSVTIQSNKIISQNNVETVIFSAFALTIIRGFSTLFDASFEYNEALIIKDKLTWVSQNWLRIDSILMILLVQYKKEYKSVQYFFDRAFNTYYRYCGLLNKTKYYTWTILLYISPKLSFNVIRYFYLKYRNVDINKFLSK